MTHRVARTIGWIVAAVLVARAAAGAADLKSLTKELFVVPATTGNEAELAAKVRGFLDGRLTVEEDALGTVAVRLKGPAGPTLLLAALDGFGHMVSGITPDGYLTLDRPVAPPHFRFDAYLLGQPVVVSTAKGPIQGVVAQPALHLLTQERRKTLVEGFSLENAYVDIGVRSEKDARAKGVEFLDAVTCPAVLTELAGGQWAGPSLGQKAVAAALVDVAAAAASEAAAEETIIAWAAQTKFSVRGRGPRPALGAARARARWLPRRAVIVDIVGAGKSDGFPFPGGGPVLIQSKDEPSSLRQTFVELAANAKISLQFLIAPDSPLTLPFSGPPSEVLTVALPVRFLHTPSEIVDLRDLQALRDLLAAFLTKGAGQ